MYPGDSPEVQKKDRSNSHAELYLNKICRKSPVVNRILSEYGDLVLEKYLKNLDTNFRHNFQNIDDLADIVYRYASRFLGSSVALKAKKDFCTNPVVLTANHHGVDYFAQSVQGSLLFALSIKLGRGSRSTVPIFSCGNVPLDNLTYPMGLLLYHVNGDQSYTLPHKLPVFSNKFRRAMVSVSSPFTNAMVQNAKKKVAEMLEGNKITSRLAVALRDIFEGDYSANDVLELSSYSQQSVILNQRIWKKLFKDHNTAPDLVYLELEEIVRRLLTSDLLNSESLAWNVFFDAKLRDKVIEELDGKKACWNINRLLKRLEMANTGSTDNRRLNSSGTIFFWGINSGGRRIPLYLDTNALGNSILKGVDDRGKLWQCPFTYESIIDALN